MALHCKFLSNGFEYSLRDSQLTRYNNIPTVHQTELIKKKESTENGSANPFILHISKLRQVLFIVQKGVTKNAKIHCTKMKLLTQPATCMLATFKKASILSDERSVYEQKNEAD